MELPLYHIPNWRTIGISVWERLRAFLQKAATVILAASAVVWLLATVPTGEIETSLLANIGHFLEPIGDLMGLGWRALVALFASFVAKENAIAVLGVLYGAGEAGASLSEVLPTAISPAAGLAFLVVQMLFIPCVSTVAAMRQETASWMWTLLNLLVLAVISLVGGVVAYQLGSLLLP
jgi:ferrous iron transport protein B